MEDALFVKLDTDGAVQWATTWGGTDQDFANDIKRVLLPGDLHSFRITGQTKSYGEGKNDVIYLVLWDAGNIMDQFTWGDSDDQGGNAIHVGALGADTYICGYTRPVLNNKALLLEFDIGPTVTSKYWNRSGIHEAKDLIYFGDKFYLVGRYKENDASIPAGFLMLVDDSTWNMNSMHYTNQTLGVEFRKLALFAAGAGVFTCGEMDDADGSVTDTYNDPASEITGIAWQAVAGTTSSVSVGAEATSGAIIEDITTAVIDAGGGGRDAAIALLKIS
jgi:hypothetical protein